MPRIFVEAGPDTGASLVLREGVAHCIGRASACSISMSDTLISRQHFKLQGLRGHWYIKNLKPGNGTKLNGESLENAETRELSHADLIEVGNSRLIFSMSEEDDQRDPLTGEVLAGYQLESLLGETSTGAVYLATNLQSGRRVALKTLPREIAQDRTRRMRLLREARITEALQHSNIISTYEHGEVGGVPYMAIEFAPQGTLLDEIRLHEGLPVRRVVSVMLQLLPALERLEESELVHRDIKPENVFCFDGGVVKLGDFGTSASLSSAKSARAHMVGSPHYMSPELADGEGVDCRSDLYSFGATLYHALEGRTMFEGTDAVSISLQHGKQGSPSPKLFRQNIPSELRDFVERLLRKSRDERFASASEALEEAKRISAQIAKALAEEPKLKHMSGGRAMTETQRVLELPLHSRPTEIRRQSARRARTQASESGTDEHSPRE